MFYELTTILEEIQTKIKVGTEISLIKRLPTVEEGLLLEFRHRGFIFYYKINPIDLNTFKNDPTMEAEFIEYVSNSFNRQIEDQYKNGKL